MGSRHRKGKADNGSNCRGRPGAGHVGGHAYGTVLRASGDRLGDAANLRGGAARAGRVTPVDGGVAERRCGGRGSVSARGARRRGEGGRLAYPGLFEVATDERGLVRTWRLKQVVEVVLKVPGDVNLPPRRTLLGRHPVSAFPKTLTGSD